MSKKSILLFMLLSLTACNEKALTDKETIALMQHCVDNGMGIRLEFNAQGPDLFTSRLSGVECRTKYDDE